MGYVEIGRLTQLKSFPSGQIFLVGGPSEIEISAVQVQLRLACTRLRSSPDFLKQPLNVVHAEQHKVER